MIDNVKPLKHLNAATAVTGFFCLAFVFYIWKNNVNLQNFVA